MNDALTVELTLDAADDLRSIHAYIASQASLAEADRMLDTLIERFSTLDQFPKRGALPKELEEIGSDDFRQLIVGRYRVFYQIETTRVRIALIVDGRRDMPGILQQRLFSPRTD